MEWWREGHADYLESIKEFALPTTFEYPEEFVADDGVLTKRILQEKIQKKYGVSADIITVYAMGYSRRTYELSVLIQPTEYFSYNEHLKDGMTLSKGTMPTNTGQYFLDHDAALDFFNKKLERSYITFNKRWKDPKEYFNEGVMGTLEERYLMQEEWAYNPRSKKYEPTEHRRILKASHFCDKIASFMS